MLPNAEVLSGLLGSLYSAAADANLWTPFLAQVAQSTNARSALLLMHNASQGGYTISSSWGVDPLSARLYHEHYSSMDVWATRGLCKPAGVVCNSEELCSREELKTTEIYNDFMRRFGMEYGMFSVIENAQSRWASISLFREDASNSFETSELELLQFLDPHLRRAFGLHFQLSNLKARSNGFEKALEMLQTGIVFFGNKGEVVFRNRSAASVFSQRDGLLETREGLKAERSNESSLLCKAILEAVSHSVGVGLSRESTLRITRRTRPALQVAISPLRDNAVNAQRPVAAVAFITDPLLRQRPTHDILHALFGLTPAECRVALLLGEGRSPRETSQILGVTFSTVRTQIRSIFSKMNVKRQGELVRILLSYGGATVSTNTDR
ncbi:MAG TPA: LuxR C-terminal-related transcriptional regulator [Verrucomicrobiae bacterium]|nr:LuxR C-terminal-related transcriptional regulator [Verrucomicrobiae bacterium]